ncbi:MAG: ABC transporter permease subunit [Betaproteobacteria bacterium]|nr:ABC transporter permease subunit [Betaproteobacteria bacterium]
MRASLKLFYIDVLKRSFVLVTLLITLWLCASELAMAASADKKTASVTVSSKRFTESYIVAEIIAETLRRRTDYEINTKLGLGNTAILFAALLQGDIDVYPEYLGTITKEILKENSVLSLAQINERLRPLNIRADVTLGFQNAYALAMRKEQAKELNIESISDLVKHPSLKIGFSHEFLGRADGWPAIQKRYGLSGFSAKGLDHGLSYTALKEKQIDLIDAYTTDAQLSHGDIVLLTDDQHFFPSYQAVLLYRIDRFSDKPKAIEALSTLADAISQTQMQTMNAAVEMRAQSPSGVAAAFLANENISPPSPAFLKQLFGPDFFRLTYEHTILVLASLLIAVLIGVPLGIFTFWNPAVGSQLLNLSGIFQTIPSLALLAFLITAFERIGLLPAITALSIYALLPLIENTHSGLLTVNPVLRESARALGAKRWICLWKIELPAAMPSIISGMKIAAITATGTATIAAFVGAGGYGERIAQGLATNNNDMMLAGAIPAACFAALLQMLLSLYQGFVRRHWR